MKLAVPILIFLYFPLIFQFTSTNIYDSDSFYHLRHAWIYQTTGIFNSAFPWVQFSVINQYSADIWYGFHLLLIPFTFLSDQILGIKLAGAFLTTFGLLIFFLVLQKLSIRYPLPWTLFLAFSSGDMLYRMNMTRPHFLTAALSIFLLYSLTKNNFRNSFLTSVAISFFHIALSWVAVLVALIEAIACVIRREKIRWQKLVVVFAGISVGWLLRPNPIGVFKLAYIQISRLLVEKLNGVPLNFGPELYPINLPVLVSGVVPILVLIALVIFLFIKLNKKEITTLNNKAFLYSCLVLSAIFLFLTFFVARRSIDFWIIFTIASVEIILTSILPKLNRVLVVGIIIFLISISLNSTYWARQFQSSANKQDQFRESAIWLEKNSNPGDIVINLRWDNFGPLFFWNQKNYYRGGMDPIFQYTYDSNLFWLNYWPEIDTFTVQNDRVYTCGSISCSNEGWVDYVNALKTEFKAKYIFVQKARNPKFKFILEKAEGVKKVYENETEAIFVIL